MKLNVFITITIVIWSLKYSMTDIRYKLYTLHWFSLHVLSNLIVMQNMNHYKALLNKWTSFCVLWYQSQTFSETLMVRWYAGKTGGIELIPKIIYNLCQHQHLIHIYMEMLSLVKTCLHHFFSNTRMHGDEAALIPSLFLLRMESSERWITH